GWQTIVFPIDENSLTDLAQSPFTTYNDSFNGITEVRILHNDVPSWEGDPIEATLDIDNIQARDNDLSIVDIDMSEQGIKVYPNPASDFIQIDGIVQEYDYIIIDINGKTITKGKTGANNSINIQNLAKGTYFLNIESKRTSKFIKQ
ncbi:T9SS type A sorting domain-containing protein, partial [Winogradskyella sp.]|uniref:T9SS type A sorting domain-containing protein n=1 Tax=Winogradskyella sp. TaxID=1883156 RepID=UPI0026267914